MEAWSQANMTAAGLKRHTPQERADMFRRMRGDMETIDVKSVENQNGTLQVTMHTKKDELFSSRSSSTRETLPKYQACGFNQPKAERGRRIILGLPPPL